MNDAQCIYQTRPKRRLERVTYDLPRLPIRSPRSSAGSGAPTNAAARAISNPAPPASKSSSRLRPPSLCWIRWQAPEPSPYFDQKLAVRLREEQAEAPAGWFERLKTRLLFNTGRQFRPAIAGALALVLLVGGGTFADLSGFLTPQAAGVRYRE